jgi:hypothetical protein
MADESVRNEALGEVRISQIIMYAARSRFAREFEQTIRNRIKSLSSQQSSQ